MQTKRKIVLDIETVAVPYFQLSERKKQLWNEKMKGRFAEVYINEEDKYSDKAAFFSLFSKIICISIINIDYLKPISYIGEEIDILTNFKNDFEKIQEHDITLIGHNIIAFDIPFIYQRLAINNLKINWFTNQHLYAKPWAENVKDTMLMWKGTSNEWYSLDYICECLQIESPKNNMHGSEVAAAFYNGEIDKIKEYCEKDVKAVKLVFNKLNI